MRAQGLAGVLEGPKVLGVKGRCRQALQHCRSERGEHRGEHRDEHRDEQ